MGTIEQPDAMEKGVEFWYDKKGVQIYEGEKGVGHDGTEDDGWMFGDTHESPRPRSCFTIHLIKILTLKLMMCQLVARCPSGL